MKETQRRYQVNLSFRHLDVNIWSFGLLCLAKIDLNRIYCDRIRRTEIEGETRSPAGSQIDPCCTTCF